MPTLKVHPPEPEGLETVETASGDLTDAVAATRSVTKNNGSAKVLPLLYSARDLATVLRVSLPTIWRLRARGKLPRPLDSLGKQLLRWNAEEIRQWIENKMPDLLTWEAMKRDQ